MNILSKHAHKITNKVWMERDKKSTSYIEFINFGDYKKESAEIFEDGYTLFFINSIKTSQEKFSNQKEAVKTLKGRGFRIDV